MAHFLPALNLDTEVPGEIEFFLRLKNDPTTKNWWVLHSYFLSKHINQSQGEIDFVVFIPNRGVVVVEVKSHKKIQVKNGDFYYGFRNKLGKNPELLPNINKDLGVTTLQNIGKKITDQFKRYSLKIKPYDLRHAWAVRTIFYDLPDTVAARMMGHSVSLHTQTYHHWITKRDQQQAVNNALSKYKKREVFKSL